ncbi:MAG: hypothetical protein ACREFE_11875 [Limisphaerales bacterium]
MANKVDYLALLQAAIRQTHKCDATHSETVPVHEMFQGQTVWKGDVEIFDLNGHPKATRCFAWSQTRPKEKGAKFVTVLEKRPVTSAETAVKAMFASLRPTPLNIFGDFGEE